METQEGALSEVAPSFGILPPGSLLNLKFMIFSEALKDNF